MMPIWKKDLRTFTLNYITFCIHCRENLIESIPCLKILKFSSYEFGVCGFQIGWYETLKSSAWYNWPSKIINITFVMNNKSNIRVVISRNSAASCLLILATLTGKCAWTQNSIEIFAAQYFYEQAAGNRRSTSIIMLAIYYKNK